MPSDYVIGGRFALQRSYIKGVGINAPSGSYLLSSANPIVVQLPVTFGSPTLNLLFKPEFFVWSSNTYTSDWITADFYGLYPDLTRPELDPLPYYFRYPPTGREAYLTPGLTFFDSYVFADLPPPPSDFWYQFAS
jgi:hypothetical protein